MARKSNKTEHVLNILTKKEEPSKSSDTEKEQSEIVSNVTINAEEVKITETPKASEPEKKAEPMKTSLEAQIKESLERINRHEHEKEEVALNEPIFEPAVIKPIDKKSVHIVNENKEDNEMAKTVKKVNTEQVVSKTSERKGQDDEDLMNIALKPDSPHYIDYEVFYENITELVLLDEVPVFMKKMGMCECNRCFSDIMAISLSNLPSHYITSDDDKIQMKKTAYKIRYKMELMVAISNACVKVKDAPRH